MRAASENSFQAGLEVLLTSMRQSDADAMVIAENLYGISDLLRDSSRLAHALTDPGRSVEDKRQLAKELLDGGVEKPTIAAIQELASKRWSDPQDLKVAVERLGNEAVLSGAQQVGQLETVEKELFAVHNFLAEHRELRINLSDLGVGTAHDRAHFGARLFQDAITPFTSRLMRRSIRRSIHGRLLSLIRDLIHQAANRRGRLFAKVTSAQPMNEQQLQRLEQILRNRYNKEIALNTVVDPSLLGGVRVQVGDDAINATVSSDIAKAKRELVR